MTTPRDAIGLSKRLRDALVDNPNYGKCLRMSLSYEDVEEAATALDALQARVKELEAECFRLAADTCHAGYGDEHGHHRCREVDDANARAARAEQERDEALERAVEAIRHAPSLDEIGYIITKDEAIKAIRRLAAGTEKERK